MECKLNHLLLQTNQQQKRKYLTRKLSNKKNNVPAEKTAPKRLKKETPIACPHADDHKLNNLVNMKEVEDNAF